MLSLLRQAAEVIEIFGTETSHQRRSSGFSAVEVVERSLDSCVDLIAVRIDVLSYGSVNDIFL
jgi:hypothetical protein